MEMEVLPGGFLPFISLGPPCRSRGRLLSCSRAVSKYILAWRERAEDTNPCSGRWYTPRDSIFMGEVLPYCSWAVEFTDVHSGFKIKFRLFTNNVLTGIKETKENRNT